MRDLRQPSVLDCGGPPAIPVAYGVNHGGANTAVEERFKLPVNLQSGDFTAKTSASSADAPIELKDLRVSRMPNTYLLLIRYRSHDSQLAAAVANDIANSYILHSYKIRYRSSVS